MRTPINRLLREARQDAVGPGTYEFPLRPGYAERVLVAKEARYQRRRRIRSLVLGGSLAGSALSVSMAAVVSHQVHDRRLAEAAMVWSAEPDEQGGTP